MNKSEEKIYGIYPGSIQVPDLIDNLDEVDLYLQIDAVQENIFWKYTMSSTAHSEINSSEDRYALEYLIYKTKKFGTKIPNPKKGRHIQLTDEYLRWYEYYENYFKNVLSENEWNEFLRRKHNNEDVSEFLPSGKWKGFTLKRKKRD